LQEDAEAVSFFSKKTPLTEKKISLENAEVDLRNQIADRIYDIRCKIVHTKFSDEDSDDVLLPSSEETSRLHYDIDLLQYLASKSLIASSSEITHEFPTI
jgi:hypothetical protein